MNLIRLGLESPLPESKSDPTRHPARNRPSPIFWLALTRGTDSRAGIFPHLPGTKLQAEARDGPAGDRSDGKAVRRAHRLRGLRALVEDLPAIDVAGVECLRQRSTVEPSYDAERDPSDARLAAAPSYDAESDSSDAAPAAAPRCQRAQLAPLRLADGECDAFQRTRQG